MTPSSPDGVFAVQCPNPKCRKYMLVEARDRSKVVPCLLCKTPIRVGGPPDSGGAGGGALRSSRPTPPPRP
jgi:hypothetical protein